MDVDISFVDNVAASTKYFHEPTILFHDANDNPDKQVVLFNFR